MQLSRKLYTRGSSFETTIPKPLLFSRDLTEKQLVTFTYDEEKGKWYIDFENEKHSAGTAGIQSQSTTSYKTKTQYEKTTTDENEKKRAAPANAERQPDQGRRGR